MRIVTKEFLNENAYISYPIDFRATYEPYSKQDASAINSILLDLKLTIPENVATTAFIASIKVTPALVSLIIMGSKETPYYNVAPSIPSYSSEEYTAFSAIVLATVTVAKSAAIQQNPIKLESAIDGVGGWVVFGPGAQINSSWSFNGPASSAIASSAITRYKYSGVKSLAKKGFDQTIDGVSFIAGQNGLEVVNKGNNILAIQFSGTTSDIKNELNRYSGECGVRPESDTCAFTPIKTVNNVLPRTSSAGKNEIVLVLDLPIYGTFRDVATSNGSTVNNGAFTLAANTPLESLCSTRLEIPNVDCDDSSLFQTAQAAIPTITFNTKLMLEATSSTATQKYVFSLAQQHPTRKSVSVFRPSMPANILDESVLELHIDVTSMQWQAYTAFGPSLRLFGPVETNLNGHRNITVNGTPVRIAIGKLNILDSKDMNSITISADSDDNPDWTGVYTREYLGRYSNSNKNYTLKMSPLNNSWAIYLNGILIVGGTIDNRGVGITTQNYKDSSGNSKVRTITAIGGVQ
jgi:hypothetical protein